MKRALHLIVFSLFVTFIISRMFVEFRVFTASEYNPTSTYAMLGIILLSIGVVIFCIPLFGIKQGLSRIILLFQLYCIINVFMNPGEGLLKTLAYVMLWGSTFLLFYYMSSIDDSFNKEAFHVCCGLSIPIILCVISLGQIRTRIFVSSSRIGNNMIYYLNALSPWLLLAKKKSARIGIMILLLVLSVLSYKRTSLIVVLLICLVFIYYEFLNKKIDIVKKIKSIIFLVLLLGIAVIYIDNKTGHIATMRLMSISEDEGSGRTDIYKDVIALIAEETDIQKIMLGHGYRTVELSLLFGTDGYVRGRTAHNDFLEVMYDFGVIGLIFYLLLHLFVIRRMVFLFKNDSPYALSYTASYAIFFFLSMFSHLIIYPTYFVLITSFWGSIEGKVYRSKQGIYQRKTERARIAREARIANEARESRIRDVKSKDEILKWARIDTMQDEEFMKMNKQLFTAVLGISEPWYIESLDLNPEQKRLDIWITYTRGAQFACPTCSKPSEIQRSDVEESQYLNFFQNVCYLHIEVPTIECTEHGVQQVKMPFQKS